MDSSTINNQTFLIRDGGGAAVAGLVTYNPTFQVASFKPVPALKANTSYTATITTGVASNQGIHIAKNYTYSFVTRSTIDASPLYVASVTPLPNAACVSPNSNITITFNEGVDVSLITAANISIMSSTAGAVPAQISYNVSNSIATLTPNAPLPLGKITVTVQGVADLADTVMTQPYVFAFSTTCGSTSGNEYLFTDSAQSGSLYGYQIDSTTGMLTLVPGSPFQPNPSSAPAPGCQTNCTKQLASDPLGRFLLYGYLSGGQTSGTSAQLATFQVNATTGALTQASNLSGYPAAVGFLSFDPLGRFVYGNRSSTNEVAAGNAITGFTINSSGTLSPTSGSPYQYSGGVSYGPPAVTNTSVYAIDVCPSPYCAASNSSIYGFGIDASTGALTNLASSPTPGGPQMAGQVVTPAGDYLYSEQTYQTNSNGLSSYEMVGYTVQTDGSLTPIAMPPQQLPFTGAGVMVMSPNGNFLYAVSGTLANEIVAYAINQNTGVLTMTGTYPIPMASGFADKPVVIDASTKYAYISGSNNTITGYSVNPTTGALAPIAGDTSTLPETPTDLSAVSPQ